jgi:5-methylcytosine-specific restriction endonuclease McrA
MWNRLGELNPNWRGGVTADRQSFYASQEWKSACSAVWKRDQATCQRCGLVHDTDPGVPFHVHHITSFAVKELRAEASNLLLVCEPCHQWIHSRRNVNREYLQEI